ncbi:uncharacterized protein N7506_006601 [Penicillium brevicompactum]|uniref:uncharacterized protein n=1 Tax=Penicillium brevicompactum TaxID=5074 RepID=UPI0025404BF7|nr:uncharacterized protein N7506_006601 [Penicillium brevicompactum]KAJ5332818.1 hypothetical protein N7506_006601 [Penicillium brevicompactum]
MDAQAYLIKHGWSGPGNPLNPNQRPGLHGGLGLTRPILVARKSNNHGVGKKTTKDASNQWWLRGFEDALKGVGEDNHEAKSAREGNALTSELYRHFVRGSGLAGTLDPKKADKTEDTPEVSPEELARLKPARRAQKAVKKEQKAVRKEARRVKRVAKVERREKKLAERAAKKAKKLEAEKEKEKEGEDYPTPMSIDQEPESKVDLDEAASRLKEKKEKKVKKSTEGEDSKKKSKKAKA